jgi:hypothetical protein
MTPAPPLTTVPSSSVLAAASSAAASGNSGAAPSSPDRPIKLGLPLGAAQGSSTDTATIAGQAVPPSGVVSHVWIGTFPNRNDAMTYWAQQRQRFPDLLRGRELTIREIDLGASQGIWFRVLGGPFASRDAEKVCQTMRKRSPADDCRAVSN